MEKKLNEFKVSTLRQFGSENLSFTATVYTPNFVLTDEEVGQLIGQSDAIIKAAFQAVCDREISEKEALLVQSDKRKEANKTLTAKIKEEQTSANELNVSGSKLKGYTK